MTSKFLSITLAGLMGVQSTAYAQEDRTTGIGDEQVRIARENVRVLKNELSALNNALEKAKETILQRDLNGSNLNGSAIAGAAVGLGFSVMAALSISKVKGGVAGAAVGGVIYGTLGAINTIASAGLGFAGQSSKPLIETAKIINELKTAESQIQSVVTTSSDKATAALLVQLEESLRAIRSTVGEYSNDETEIAKSRLAAQIAQATGVAILVYGATQKNAKALLVGPLIMNAGNLGQMLVLLKDSDAQKVLNEIESARRSLAAAAVALE